MATPRVRKSSDVKGAQEAIAAASAIFEAADRAQKSLTEIVMASGIVIGLRPVPPFALEEATRQLVPPEAPSWENPANGRTEPNPDDPDYRIEVLAWSQHQLAVVSNVLMVLGTYCKSVPDGCYKPDDDGWIEELEFVGIHLEFNGTKERYMAWLKMYAMAERTDISNLTVALMRRTGVTEVEVGAAVAAFRRSQGRGADRGGAGKDERGNGDRV